MGFNLNRGKRICEYCKKEIEAYIISPVYYCPKCGKLWSYTETLYECTRNGCYSIFSRSESEGHGYRANQCPDCRWPYGRIYTTEACPNCLSSLITCEKGEIALCQTCGRWSFIKEKKDASA